MTIAPSQTHPLTTPAGEKPGRRQSRNFNHEDTKGTQEPNRRRFIGASRMLALRRASIQLAIRVLGALCALVVKPVTEVLDHGTAVRVEPGGSQPQPARL